MKRKNILLTMAVGAMLLLFAACSQEMMTDGSALPEGKYPLQIASVTMSAESGSPSTRVTENSDGTASVWSDGDQIGVQIGADDANRGVYTMNVASGTVTSLSPQTPLYWQNTLPATLHGWYPTGGTIDLSDQRAGLKYVLKGSSATPMTYQTTDPAIAFTNQLAKVRVTLTGAKATSVTAVSVKGYTSCTNTQGSVAAAGNADGYIKMKKTTYGTTDVWEANVVPGYEIKDFKLNGTTACTLSTSIANAQAGYMYPIALTVNSAVYKVGDYYPNATSPIGVVFWIDTSDTSYDSGNNTSAKGKIVSLDETNAYWSTSSEVTGATNATDGLANMATIQAYIATNSQQWSDYPAFNWVNSKNTSGTIYATGTKNVWYLPAIDELTQLYNSLTLVNANLNSISAMAINLYYRYWSSTDYDGWAAKYRKFSSSTSGASGKDDSFQTVRAVMAF